MPLVCIHCSLKAFLDGTPAPDLGEQTSEEHMQRYHPDLDATRSERQELERRAAERLFRDDEH
jgi:hypothetical protein